MIDLYPYTSIRYPIAFGQPRHRALFFFIGVGGVGWWWVVQGFQFCVGRGNWNTLCPLQDQERWIGGAKRAPEGREAGRAVDSCHGAAGAAGGRRSTKLKKW